MAKTSPENSPAHNPFRKSNYIGNATDGWLCPDGSFYRCAADQHDECAQFVQSSEKIKSSDPHLPCRFALLKEGFAQLSTGRLVKGKTPLTPDQTAALQNARIESDTPCPDESPLLNRIKLLAQGESEPIKKSVLSQLASKKSFEVDTSTKEESDIYQEVCDEIFNTLTQNFTDVSHTFPMGDTLTTAYPTPNSPVGVTYWQHTHLSRVLDKGYSLNLIFRK